MPKVAKSFRLDPVAVSHLDELVGLTGSNQAAVVEHSLAVYRSFLTGGLDSLARTRRMHPRTSPNVQDAPPVSQTPPPPLQRTPKPEASGSHKVRGRNGTVYEFSFSLEQLPKKGSLKCPCGSGKLFSRCHTEDFKKAIKAGITVRG